MFQLISNLISIALYVLYALGLYTIANRRGIKHAWLAWVPVGSAWILGSISDQYKERMTGRKHGMRTALVILTALVLVLSVATLACSFAVIGSVLSDNELGDFVASVTGLGNEMYTLSEEEMVALLETKLEQSMTDEVMEQMVAASAMLLVACLFLAAAAIAEAVIECICMYNLFASCDPANKLVFFLVGLFINLWPVFVFICRNKDEGMQPPRPVAPYGYMPPYPQWQQPPYQQWQQPPYQQWQQPPQENQQPPQDE